jgi:hypothetical protein
MEYEAQYHAVLIETPPQEQNRLYCDGDGNIT